jgi:hypothetical protein
MGVGAKLKAAWVHVRIALVEGDDGRGITGWLFLLVPATVISYFLARSWGLGWILFVGCCAGLVGGVLLPLLLLVLRWKR